MKQNRALVSLLIAAALSIPSIVLAADLQNSVPSSTDEARAMAAHRPNQDTPVARPDYRPDARISSTDEARAAAAERQEKPATVMAPSECAQVPAPHVTGSTDEARASFGRSLVESCAQHA